MRILVALSGGVDSSTTAYLLHEAGHDLVGVHLLLWMDPLAPPLASILPQKCCSTEARNRVKSVAKHLGIPLHVVDCSDEFHRRVVDPYLKDSVKGLTPNPCVKCNPEFKFASLLALADEHRCEAIATGHYARIRKSGQDVVHLLEAADKAKDQSYFLYRLTQHSLQRSLFPLGERRKEEVIALARELGIPLPAKYQESQDLCFFPEKEPHAFLDRYLPAAPGDIIDTDGKHHGKHRGLFHYTEGQRKGLKIGGLKIPLHVVRKDSTTNTLIVGTKEEATQSRLTAGDLTWVAASPEPYIQHTYDIRIHAGGDRIACAMTHDGSVMTVTLVKPCIGVSPGQSAVLYEGERVVGGGMIQK